MLGMPNTPSFCIVCMSRKVSKNNRLGSPSWPMMPSIGMSRSCGPMNW